MSQMLSVVQRECILQDVGSISGPAKKMSNTEAVENGGRVTLPSCRKKWNKARAEGADLLVVQIPLLAPGPMLAH